MKARFTHLMCPLMASLAFAAATELAFSGVEWARWCLFASMAVAVPIGIPASVLAMAGKIVDDRVRLGRMRRFSAPGAMSSTVFSVIYMTATLAVLVSVAMTVAALYRGGPGVGIVPHSDALEVSTYGIALGGIGSFSVAYLQRGRGRGLVGTSLFCGLAYLLILVANACMF